MIDLLRGVREYVYPVGRLDYDTEGLLLLTNDGDLAARLTHPRHDVERTYEAHVAGMPDEDAIASCATAFRSTGGGRCRRRPRLPERARGGQRDRARSRITIREGRNRQVRRMCEAVGHPVRELTRTRIGPISDRQLKPGEWRELSAAEVTTLQALAARPAPTPPPRRLVQRQHVLDRRLLDEPAGGSKPSASAMSSIFGRSFRSFRPNRIRNSFVVA